MAVVELARGLSGRRFAAGHRPCALNRRHPTPMSAPPAESSEGLIVILTRTTNCASLFMRPKGVAQGRTEGVRCQVSGVRCQVSGSRSQKSGVRRQTEKPGWPSRGNSDCQLSTVDSRLLLRDLFLWNEAKKLLKIKDRIWNEPKRTQETSQGFCHLIENTVDSHSPRELKGCLSY